MKDQDLQRLFDYFDAPSHASHSIRRHEALTDVIAQWPVLGEANDLVIELLDRTTPSADSLQEFAERPVDAPEHLR